VNNQRIVLAFNGHPASCAAVRWLADQYNAEVIALIVDVGQGDDPEELYGRAFASGAHNVHVVDRCEEFARRAVVPAAAGLATLDERALRHLSYPVIAAALVEMARIECADTVAHASVETTLDAEIHALDPALRVFAPARDAMHHVSAGAVHPDRHLLMRRAAPVVASATENATVTIGFEAGVPRSVNGVIMELSELIESLSLMARQCHVDDANPAPALLLLQRAYRESAGVGSVTMTLGANPDEPASPERIARRPVIA
jgi:argininosuccinate synthase